MMKPIEIRKVCLEDLRTVATGLRAADEVELSLLTKQAPYEALVKAVSVSKHSFIGYVDGEPSAAFGVASVLPDVGIPWLLGTNTFAANYKSWLPFAQGWVNWMNEEYQTITNVVHNKNKKSIRWLKKLGFTFLETPVPGLPTFIQFVRYRDV